MTIAHEIEGLRHRATAIERELAEVKFRLLQLERSVEAGREMPPVAPPELVPAAPPPAPPAPAATITPVALAVPPELRPEVAPPVRTSEPDAPSDPPRIHPWREWLEPLQLWPPSGEQNAEIRLAAWWTTRVGALLAVIGVVFLGGYVSRGAAPWVRLLEVMAVTAATIGLGSWLERKLPTFGAVVFGAGLALAYFCAFAAYAVEPMKVIDRPQTAMLCELAVVAGIFGLAWRRGSPVAATMAVVLGHVTGFLALRAGPVGFGPWVILVLGAVAVLFRILRGWTAPSAWAMPLAWAYLAYAVARQRIGVPPLAVTAAWVWCAMYFALFWLRDWLVAWRGGDLARIDRTVQVANSSLAFAVGLLAAAQVGGDRMAPFYFGAGVLLLGATVGWRTTAAGAPLVPIFACKAASLVGLGVIAAWEGHARSLVLLTQAFALLVSARQSQVRGLRAATLIAGAVALAFFLAQIRPGGPGAAESGPMLDGVFLVGAAAFVAALRRWLDVGRTTAALGAVALGVTAIAAVLAWPLPGWTPAVLVSVGVALAATAAALRCGEVASILGGLLVVTAHTAAWGLRAPTEGATVLWLNTAVLLGAAAGGVAGVWRFAPAASDGRWQLLERGIVGLTLGTVTIVGFCTLPAPAALAVAAGLGATLAVAVRGRTLAWAELGAPLLALGLGLFFVQFGGKAGGHWLAVATATSWFAAVWWARRAVADTSRAWQAWQAGLAAIVTLAMLVRWVPADGRLLAAAVTATAVFALSWRPQVPGAQAASWAIWLATIFWASGRLPDWKVGVAALLAWVPAVALARGFGRRAAAGENRHAPAVQVVLASLLGVVAAFGLPGLVAQLAALGALAGVAFLAWRLGDVGPARVAVTAVAGGAWFLGMGGAGEAPLRVGSTGLALLSVTGIAVTLLPLGAGRGLARDQQQHWRWIGAVAGLMLVFRGLAAQSAPVRDYATVGWGAMAVASFLLGLFARSRPHRLVGLGGLAACVGRAVVVDIDSTLYRIVAFTVLGCVLLWVGFSYHRFRHLVADEEKKH